MYWKVIAGLTFQMQLINGRQNWAQCTNPEIVVKGNATAAVSVFSQDYFTQLLSQNYFEATDFGGSICWIQNENYVYILFRCNILFNIFNSAIILLEAVSSNLLHKYKTLALESIGLWKCLIFRCCWKNSLIHT